MSCAVQQQVFVGAVVILIDHDDSTTDIERLGKRLKYEEPAASA
jgi:hypothetical protein